jgi:hypothetical protein
MGSGVIANGGWTLDKASSFGSEVVYLVRRVQIAWDYLEETGQIDDGAFHGPVSCAERRRDDPQRRAAPALIVEPHNHLLRAA